MDLKATLLEAFIKYLVPIIFSVLSVLLAKLLAAASRKADASTSSSLVLKVASKFSHFAELVTKDLEATMKAKLKEATADGKLTPEEFKMLRDVAIDRVKTLAGENGIKELGDILGVFGEGINTYIGGMVEKEVATINPSPAVAVAVAGSPSPLGLPGGLPVPPSP